TFSPSGAMADFTPLSTLMAIDVQNGGGLGLPLILEPGQPGSCSTPPYGACVLDTTMLYEPLRQCVTSWHGPAIVLGATDIDLADPTLDANETEMYFTRGPRIHRAVRNATSGWVDTGEVANLYNGTTNNVIDQEPKLSPDGLTMYLSRTLGPGLPDDIW